VAHHVADGPQLSPDIGQAQTPSAGCQALSLGADPSGLWGGNHLKLPDKRLLAKRVGDNGACKSP
jgi:hypothetical protein